MANLLKLQIGRVFCHVILCLRTHNSHYSLNSILHKPGTRSPSVDQHVPWQQIQKGPGKRNANLDAVHFRTILWSSCTSDHFSHAIILPTSFFPDVWQQIPSLILTARTWKWMIWNPFSFPSGAFGPIFRAIFREGMFFNIPGYWGHLYSFTGSTQITGNERSGTPKRWGNSGNSVTAYRCVPGGVGFRPLGRILVVRWDQGQSDFEERKICVDLSAGQSWVP